MVVRKCAAMQSKPSSVSSSASPDPAKSAPTHAVPGIEAHALVKQFPGIDAVRGVDLRVARGEVVGLLGPNGAGKTTTLRMLAGILKPSQGRAAINGFDVATQTFEARGCLGYLSGSTALYARLSVREVLRYFGRLHGMTDGAIAERTEQLADDLDLRPFLDRRCGVLSSGQQQRAKFARAFLHDPPVLILDEPTASLDVVTGNFILESIRQARDNGRAVLLSTHIMSEAEVLCDRIMLLHEGRILNEGTLAEILEQSGEPNLTYAFLSYVQNAKPGSRP